MYSTLLIVKAADSYAFDIITESWCCCFCAYVWWKIMNVTRIIKEQFKTESIVLYANGAQMHWNVKSYSFCFTARHSVQNNWHFKALIMIQATIKIFYEEMFLKVIEGFIKRTRWAMNTQIHLFFKIKMIYFYSFSFAFLPKSFLTQASRIFNKLESLQCICMTPMRDAN